MDPRLVENPTFLRYYERWQSDPKSVVFAAISEIFRGYGMIDEAIRVAEEGLKNHPDLVSGRLALSKAYLASGDFVRAKEEAMRVIAISPNNFDAAAVLESLKEFDRASEPVVIDSFETSIAKNEASQYSPRQTYYAETPQTNSAQNTSAYDYTEEITEDMPLSAIEQDDETIPEEIESPKEENTSADDEFGEDVDVEAESADSSDEQKEKASLNPAWHTITMARILASQGHAGQAKKIYRSILDRDPKNEAARLELSKL